MKTDAQSDHTAKPMLRADNQTERFAQLIEAEGYSHGCHTDIAMVRHTEEMMNHRLKR